MNASATIGDNSPPPFEAMSLHIEELLDLAKNTLDGSGVKSQAQADGVADLQAQIKEAAKDAEAQRKAEKKPHDDAGKAVQAKWKPLLDKAKIATDTAALALTPWLHAQEVERRRIADEKRKEAEKLAADALAKFQESKPDDLEARYEADELAAKAKKATITANKVDRTATGLRTYWTATVTNYRALLAYMKASEPDDLKAMLDEYVEKQKNAGVRKMDGVTFTDEKRVT